MNLKLNLKKKLIVIFILITTVPLSITTIITSYVSYTTIVKDAFQNNSTISKSLARELNLMLDAKIKTLNIMSKNPELQSMDTSRQLTVLRHIASQYTDMTSVVVANAQGIQTVRTEGNLAKIDDREYFKEIIKGAKFVISDVIVAKGTGNKSIVIGVPILDTSGVLHGVLLGVVELKYLNNYIAQTKLGETGYAFLVDKEGKVLAHPDNVLVEQMADISNLEPVKLAISGQEGVSEYESQGIRKLAGFSFVPNSRWGLVVQQDMDEAIYGALKVRMTGIIVTIIAIILAGLIGMLVAGVLTKPIKSLLSATRKMADGDFTIQVDVTTKDEFGQLSQSFNTMINNLQHLIRQVINTAEQVAASSQQLSATSSEAERAVIQISATVTESAQGAQKQTEEVAETVTIVSDLAKASQDAAAKAQDASKLSSQMAYAAETGGKATQSAVDKMIEIKKVTTDTSQTVIALGDKSTQIGQIMNVINDIAGQTNLLALNAAIEAARAGEQGRGFAVVADEVRKLAEQSQEAAKKITVIIREIQGQTGQAIEAMQLGSAKVTEGVEVVQTVGEALNDILFKVQSSVGMIEDIANSTNHQLTGTQNVVKSINEIAKIAKQSSSNSQQTAAATHETTASMGEIAGAAHSLAVLATELQSMVMRFKII